MKGSPNQSNDIKNWIKKIGSEYEMEALRIAPLLKDKGIDLNEVNLNTSFYLDLIYVDAFDPSFFADEIAREFNISFPEEHRQTVDTLDDLLTYLKSSMNPQTNQ